jgi:hypothetical protein
MNREITIEIEKLIAMFVIAKGMPICGAFVYEPKLPKPISEGIKFNGCCPTNAKLICLRANSDFKVECWFIGTYDGKEKGFDMSLEELKMYQPILFASIFTHVYDMIENIEED